MMLIQKEINRYFVNVFTEKSKSLKKSEFNAAKRSRNHFSEAREFSSGAHQPLLDWRSAHPEFS
jgi:hypothetical protein